MASIHKQPGKPNWFCAFSIYNPKTNRWQRAFRSTETSNKKQALEICRTWQAAAEEGYKGTLSVDACRDIIERGVSDIYRITSDQSLPSKAIKSWCDAWLNSKAGTIRKSTQERYKNIIEQFIAFLDDDDAKSERRLVTLQADDIARFRDHQAKELSIGTANLSLNVLRMCFNDAVLEELLTVNPAARVKYLVSSEESRRRAFTMDEIRRILEACADDIEWTGLTKFALYLGQRLGDLRKLTWRAVNLESNEIAFTATKTGRRIVLPLMPPLVDYLSELPANDDPNAFIFPNAAKHKHTASLSNQFREILIEAGLVEPRQYSATKGRFSPRETSEISFHSLRHSAVTMLKAAGVSDFMTMQIVGHESSAISRQYSHLSTDDLRRAMSKLPDVSTSTKTARGKRGAKK
jgi:integrase